MRPSPARLSAGLLLLALGVCGSLVWLVWRVATLELHPVPVLALLLELGGAGIGAVVALALARVETRRTVHASERHDTRRYGFAVADLVGRTRAEDLHRDVRSLARAWRHPGGRDLADLAVACVVIEGPRRLALVAIAVFGLLVGVSPIPAPSLAALAALAAGVGGLSLAAVVLSNGRIGVADRLRWSYSSLGEIVVRDDIEGVAPRRWVGTVATIVVINLAVALRGMSDRWTHGLPVMGNEARIVAMVFAMTIVVGALCTLLTTPAPDLDNAHLVSRRLEERTARQSALGGAICVGLIGLLAGVLPGCVDPADDDAARIEQVSELEAAGAGTVADG
jgi:hypothetical protein